MQNLHIAEPSMYKINTKPASQFEQLRNQILTPTQGIQHTQLEQWTLPPRNLIFRSKSGEERTDTVHQFLVTRSRFEASSIGVPFDPFFRTNILMQSDLGVVLLALNYDLLRDADESSFSKADRTLYTRAYPKAQARLEGEEIISDLPFISIENPIVEDFEELFSPNRISELNPLQIFASIAAYHFWTDDEVSFDVYLERDDSQPCFKIIEGEYLKSA